MHASVLLVGDSKEQVPQMPHGSYGPDYTYKLCMGECGNS